MNTTTLLNRIGIAIACALALFLLWTKLFPMLLVTRGFSPHGDCFLWNPKLLALFVGSDTSIGLAYIVISATLAYLVAKVRRSLPFQWIFLAFGIFIVACGGTHLLDVWTLWVPTYWLAGAVKLVTAIASITTAIILPFMLPNVFALIAMANGAQEQTRQLEQAHRELAGLYEQSKELDRLKTSFFANVSHELRTPLTLILGPVKSLLAQETATKRDQQTLRIVERNADLLLKRINDLLDSARLEAGKMELTYTRVDLVQIAQESAAYFEARAEQQQIRVSIEAPLSVLADVDQEKLERILFNLFSNAFKFTPPGGQIRCVVSSEGEWGIITLQDTGPGIAPELRQEIFKRFRQGSSEGAGQVAGTGLGLAIAKEFVELHGGTIEADEASGGGARFTIRVPLSAPRGYSIAETLPTKIPQPPVSAYKEKELFEAALPAGEEEDARAAILVIEDNQEMAQFIANILIPDYHVTLAHDGQDGLEKALKDQPDLVLCDVMMPRMNGEQFLRAFRQHAKFDAIPVMILSAQTDSLLRVRLLHLGAQDFLLKPFQPDEVRARVANLIMMKLVRGVLQQEVTQQRQDLVSLVNEVTRRKRESERAVEALGQIERDFKLLADAMPQMVWTSRPDGWLDYYNQRWFDYTGMTLEQTKGWGWKPVLHPDDLQRCIDIWTNAVQTGGPYEIEYRFKRASDGTYRWHLGRALPVRDMHGKIVKWFGTCTDIDDQKQNEEALRENEYRKDLFLSMASHELKTPLTSLQIFVEVLHEECDASGLQSLVPTLVQIEAQVQRLQKLITNLLDISRVQMGKLALSETW
ncbi:MAG TPA: histidine kinase dimerization/phospho-acceptor domain-containing protein, partial [Ktedonobacteraceae bacterium]|nr:histidine kinase dimerization/phospho-acceptor domain-containing protein [Ktedonobacteraceae bacterium]